ncbi:MULTISPECIES: TetR family transcriptional regulator [unclassified Rhodococcus (in: high G+C Gram-positive bacteria)]|uniref:TetR/AcrR family transcriptional regulator n=1 Tax=unclassified Rhodococcus (in: high G+C Gram-positive bacteria) TaxID=192944 RepID=UPI00144532AD|nr:MULTISPECIES: TetR family transcriptional regulator [unclassified Rhodococcus (in: high G+C Gram-positive bacteria)]
MVGAKKSELERRSDILAAAKLVALDGGLETVTARTVAAEADLSSGLVYFYYQTKNGLLHALLARLLETTLDGPEDGFGEDLPADVALHEMITTELEGLHTQRDEVDLLFQFYFFRRSIDFRDQIDTGLRLYTDAIHPVTDRFAREHDLDPDAFRSTLVALIQGAAIDVVRRPESFSAANLLQVVAALATSTPRHSEDAI